MKKKSDSTLDKDEKALLESVEAGEWTSVKDVDKFKAKAKGAASRSLKKDARVNVRIPNVDLMRIKRIAAFEGLPYQTLIASVLHKFAAGHFERRYRKNER